MKKVVKIIFEKFAAEEDVAKVNMSSSTFEVKDTENEKVIGFGLENCDENGITMATQVDSELPKDHTYTKEPDVLEGDLTKSSETTGNQLDGAEDHATAEKPRASRGTKAQKVTKKLTSKAKSKSPKKNASSKKSQTKKEVLSHEGNTVSEVVDEEKSNEKQGPVADEEQSKAKRKSRKRKFEEKENVLDHSIVEEVENISEEAINNNSSDENATKKKNAADAEEATKAKKVAKAKKVLASDGAEDQHNLPKGWVRKTVVRKSGKTAGQVDVYIYSPEGIKFRSKPDIAAYLARTKSPLKLDDFSFSKKLSDSSSVKPAVKKEKLPSSKLASPAKKKAKQSVASPKKSPKLLVKINFAGKSKQRNVKKSAEKASKSPVKEKLNSNYGMLSPKNGKVAKLPQLDGKTSKEKSVIKEPCIVLDNSLKKVTSGSTAASKRKSLPPRRLIEEDNSHEIPSSPRMQNANISHSPARHKRKSTPPSRLIPE
ncbi:methyl-CpG-binding protein 2-like, partial [Stegodyphus dumicola]|uniref:methyl-CpG-binding protein 2-like n=1 Tax=Stegodyphus dumicola TaxID=202533 RepID=UPI0015ABFA1A